MKKESTVVNKKGLYEVIYILKNTGVAKSVNGQKCLVNIKTHELIGDFDNYSVTYYSDTLYYFLRKCVYKDGKGTLYVTIYDADNEKLYGKNLIQGYGEYPYTYYQDPETNKFHIFDMRAERNGKDVFSKEYDSLELLLDAYYGKLTITEINGKKGLYISEGNFIEEELNLDDDYDNIYLINKEGIIVFERGEEAFFAFYDCKKMVFSKKYKSIKVDPNQTTILYCETENGIDVYNTANTMDKSRRLLCSFPKYEEISCCRYKPNGRFIFKVKDKKTSKFGLYGVDDDKRKFDDLNAPSPIKIVDVEYDKIDYEHSEDYYLYKGDKKGLYNLYAGGDKRTGTFIEAKHDDIKRIDALVAIYKGELCDIYELKNLEEPLVSQCEIVANNSDSLVYKKGDKFGLIIRSDRKFVVKDGYTNVVYKGRYNYRDMYITEKDNKKGLVHETKDIIPEEHNDIILNGDNIKNFSYNNQCFIALKDEKFKLAKFNKTESLYAPKLEMDDTECENIEFFENIYTIYDGEKTRIYGYNQNLLQEFDGNPVITCQTVKTDNKNFLVYYINGVYYTRSGDNFEPAIIEEYDSYVTTYETDDSFYTVESVYRKEYEEFLEYIASLPETQAEEELKTLSIDNNMQKKYPKLTLIKEGKEKNIKE